MFQLCKNNLRNSFDAIRTIREDRIQSNCPQVRKKTLHLEHVTGNQLRWKTPVGSVIYLRNLLKMANDSFLVQKPSSLSPILTIPRVILSIPGVW